MARYSATKDFKGAYRFSKEAIEALADIVAKHVGRPVEVSFTFAKGHSLEVDVSEIGKDPLFRSEEIDSVSMYGFAKDSTDHARVRISNAITSISLQFDGEKDKSLASLTNAIQEIEGARTWYWFLYQWDTWLGFGAILLAAVITNIWNASLGRPYQQDYLNILGGTAILFLVLGTRRLFFRRAEFSIGIGEQKSKNRFAARKWVFVTVIAGGVIAGFYRQIFAWFGI